MRLNLMRIALELAMENHVYEDIATKFFEHFLYIADAMTQDRRKTWPLGRAGRVLLRRAQSSRRPIRPDARPLDGRADSALRGAKSSSPRI